MFNSSKYTLWYYNIINRAKNRIIDNFEYTENHHIIPKSMDGDDSPNNIVCLYFREHFIVHRLLPKMCLKRLHIKKMNHALSYFMTSKHFKRRLNSRQSTICKKAHIAACRGHKLSLEHRRKISETLSETHPWKGRKHTPETKEKMKKAKRDSSYIPPKEKNKNHSILMSGEGNSRSKRVLVNYNGVEVCYKCLKYFHYDSGINYSTLRKIAQREYYSEYFKLKINYID